MLDYLYEIKDSKNSRTIDKHPFKKEDFSNLFNNEKEIGDYFKKKNMIPIEMESVHVEINKKDERKGIFSIFRKKQQGIPS